MERVVLVLVLREVQRGERERESWMDTHTHATYSTQSIGIVGNGKEAVLSKSAESLQAACISVSLSLLSHTSLHRTWGERCDARMWRRRRGMEKLNHENRSRLTLPSPQHFQLLSLLPALTTSPSSSTGKTNQNTFLLYSHIPLLITYFFIHSFQSFFPSTSQTKPGMTTRRRGMVRKWEREERDGFRGQIDDRYIA